MTVAFIFPEILRGSPGQSRDGGRAPVMDFSQKNRPGTKK